MFNVYRRLFNIGVFVRSCIITIVVHVLMVFIKDKSKNSNIEAVLIQIVIQITIKPMPI